MSDLLPVNQKTRPNFEKVISASTVTPQIPHADTAKPVT
jgi:hypothetical protein